jgi:arabinan endo-1,5-alpha-L-arabinosidase
MRLIVPLLIGWMCFFAEASAQSTYINPVYAANFPDPTIVRGHDGWFYVYGTNAEVSGRLVHIQVARSQDMVTWHAMGDALPEMPAWADKDFWAPHVTFDAARKKYYMYYSGESPEAKTGKCIGVAVSEKPEGPFVDTGKPLICGESFINIDPMTFDDPATGRIWLYWGSAHLPIRVQELGPDRISFKTGSVPKDVLKVYKKSAYGKLIEGPWLHYRNGYYYLFYSGDNCCGDQANYAVMVARSRNPEGPFEEFEAKDTGSKPILIKNETWIAPGHNSVVTDDAGNDWIVYHAIGTEPKIKEQGRVMLIDRIVYKDNWPSIEGSVPSTTPQVKPVIRNRN